MLKVRKVKWEEAHTIEVCKAGVDSSRHHTLALLVFLEKCCSGSIPKPRDRVPVVQLDWSVCHCSGLRCWLDGLFLAAEQSRR